MSMLFCYFANQDMTRSCRAILAKFHFLVVFVFCFENIKNLIKSFYAVKCGVCIFCFQFMLSYFSFKIWFLWHTEHFVKLNRKYIFFSFLYLNSSIHKICYNHFRYGWNWLFGYADFLWYENSATYNMKFRKLLYYMH